jgi:hypothetical protein
MLQKSKDKWFGYVFDHFQESVNHGRWPPEVMAVSVELDEQTRLTSEKQAEGFYLIIVKETKRILGGRYWNLEHDQMDDFCPKCGCLIVDLSMHTCPGFQFSDMHWNQAVDGGKIVLPDSQVWTLFFPLHWTP